MLTTDSAPIIALGILPPWLLREAMWWTLIPILIGVLTALLRRSTWAAPKAPTFALPSLLPTT